MLCHSNACLGSVCWVYCCCGIRCSFCASAVFAAVWSTSALSWGLVCWFLLLLWVCCCCCLQPVLILLLVDSAGPLYFCFDLLSIPSARGSPSSLLLYGLFSAVVGFFAFWPCCLDVVGSGMVLAAHPSVASPGTSACWAAAGFVGLFVGCWWLGFHCWVIRW